MQATAAVGSAYFFLPIASADAVYRERVYCYELYHQLRMRWNAIPKLQGLSISGEVDKAGHPLFDRGAHYKPDFLVHEPGSMNRNTVVVEVKPSTAGWADLRADLRKLAWFCSDKQYREGILLVYGTDDGGLVARIQQAVAATESDLTRVAVLHHERPGHSACLLTFL